MLDLCCSNTSLSTSILFVSVRAPVRKSHLRGFSIISLLLKYQPVIGTHTRAVFFSPVANKSGELVRDIYNRKVDYLSIPYKEGGVGGLGGLLHDVIEEGVLRGNKAPPSTWHIRPQLQHQALALDFGVGNILKIRKT